MTDEEWRTLYENFEYLGFFRSFRTTVRVTPSLNGPEI